jgi:hypothetical protein
MARWLIEKDRRDHIWDLYERNVDDGWYGSFSTHRQAVEAMVEIEKEEAQDAAEFEAAYSALTELRRYEDEQGMDY